MSIFSSIDAAKKIWATVAAVVPAVEAFVQQVEAAFPAGSKGADKLAQVKAFLAAIWGDVEGVEASLEQAWPAISSFIGALVAMYNARGVFTKIAQAV